MKKSNMGGNMKKENNIIIGIVIIILLLGVTYNSLHTKQEIRSIKNDRDFYRLYQQEGRRSISFFERMLTIPFSLFYDSNDFETYGVRKNTNMVDMVEETSNFDSQTKEIDYSETNIQVEGVDEADIIKTDGNYIYSLSESSVVITNVKDPENIKVEATISRGNIVPEELLLYENYLVVISTKVSENQEFHYYRYYNRNNTVVDIYDITEKNLPKRVKNFELEEPYYTTRCIDGKLYIFSKGYLREKNDKIERNYKEDNHKKQIEFQNIKYIKDHMDNIQTLIAELDLNKMNDIQLSSYLIDISNAYISKDNIYLLDSSYEDGKIKISSLFTWKGIIGFIEDLDTSYYEKTTIYKFHMDSKKGVTYQTNTKVDGHTINQYSLDEKEGNLRVALKTEDGSKISVFNKKLRLIGETEPVEEEENMYAARFLGDRAYFVTYRNTDPLFVIDLSDPKNPTIMGELHIPGYSTYLHPYDENHLIGIGMDTKETINRDINGEVISSWVNVTGMKMSLFDVSDIENPREIDKTTIGDSQTVSAILTNPKALLFSKKKHLLAIPVNHYQEDFILEDSEMLDVEIEEFTDHTKDYVSEGYFVYHIDLEGFQLKGTITHEKEEQEDYYYSSKLLRGLYIEDNLYTISEDWIKVHTLSDLEEISNLKIKGDQ